MEFTIFGLATAFNFIIIISKFKNGRYFDSVLDLSLLVTICFLFSGTFSALCTGMCASVFVSLWLYFNPLTFKLFTANLSLLDDDDDYDDYDD